MPPVKTRDRILLTSLELFNLCGEPNTTTIDIANEMDISPGNLYYHFRNKDEIINELFAMLEASMNEVLEPPREATLEMLDFWMYTHLLLEKIWEFRFFYRDTISILERNDRLQKRFNRILDRKHATWKAILESMRANEQLIVGDDALETLCSNAVMMLTCWLGYRQLRSLSQGDADIPLDQGVFQLMSLIAPYLSEEEQDTLAAVAATYL